jgi:hypothetical protein
MSNPLQGGNATPKAAMPASPQHQTQGNPKPADKQPNEQQK